MNSIYYIAQDEDSLLWFSNESFCSNLSSCSFDIETSPHDLDIEAMTLMGRRSRSRYLARVCCTALPLQMLMLLLLGVACLVPMTEEDFSCILANNFQKSLDPMLKYPDGPPPFWGAEPTGAKLQAQSVILMFWMNSLHVIRVTLIHISDSLCSTMSIVSTYLFLCTAMWFSTYALCLLLSKSVIYLTAINHSTPQWHSHFTAENLGCETVTGPQTPQSLLSCHHYHHLVCLHHHSLSYHLGAPFLTWD